MKVYKSVFFLSLVVLFSCITQTKGNCAAEIHFYSSLDNYENVTAYIQDGTIRAYGIIEQNMHNEPGPVFVIASYSDGKLIDVKMTSLCEKVSETQERMTVEITTDSTIDTIKAIALESFVSLKPYVSATLIRNPTKQIFVEPHDGTNEISWGKIGEDIQYKLLRNGNVIYEGTETQFTDTLNQTGEHGAYEYLVLSNGAMVHEYAKAVRIPKKPADLPETMDRLIYDFNDATQIDGISFKGSDYQKKNRVIINGKITQNTSEKGWEYIPFAVDSSRISNSVKQLKITVTYWADKTEPLTIEYQMDDGDNKYKKTGTVKHCGDRFEQAKFIINDAYFNKGQNNNADFRIYSSSGSIKILRIEVTKLPDPTEYQTTVTDTHWGGFNDKVIAGYQGWFITGTETGGWSHWSSGRQPSKGFQTFELYPDMSEYPEESRIVTGYEGLGDGSDATLYSSNDEYIIDTHFRWMQEYDIDGVALQRFYSGIRDGGDSGVRNNILSVNSKVSEACSKWGRQFYIMYDCSGAGENGDFSKVAGNIMRDMAVNVSGYFNTPQYMTKDGMPVVCFYGVGMLNKAAGTPEDWQGLITYLKETYNCYVIVGAPSEWRTGTSGVQKHADFEAEDFMIFDCVSPWYVGRFNNEERVQNYYEDNTAGDIAMCDSYGVDFQPVMFPGFAWSNFKENAKANEIPRSKGLFFWQQLRSYLDIDTTRARTIYLAMFDEYDEATAWAKAASDSTQAPVDQYFLTLSEDGEFLSSDFYLRLAQKAAGVLKGRAELTDTPEIPYTNGDLLFRTGFETRDHNFTENQLIGTQEATTATCSRQSGGINGSAYAVKLTATAVAGEDVEATFGVADLDIPIKEPLKLNFSANLQNSNGARFFVGVILDDDPSPVFIGYLDNLEQGHWENGNFKLTEVGKTIKKLVVGMNEVATEEGECTILFDNFSIETE